MPCTASAASTAGLADETSRLSDIAAAGSGSASIARRELRDGLEPAGVAGVPLAEVLELAALGRERRRAARSPSPSRPSIATSGAAPGSAGRRNSDERATWRVCPPHAG